MGYLTANPGCHFRALMSALDMSNGQITHHLRVLETEEHVWRKSDGRLVRFYPFTNQLHPNMPEDELPVPPLSPDPNSLQGKILNVLDHDGGLGQFPTQAELAKWLLEKSQQLISHHLRTLQKVWPRRAKENGCQNRTNSPVRRCSCWKQAMTSPKTTLLEFPRNPHHARPFEAWDFIACGDWVGLSIGR